jgi:hypothetical protein
MKKREIHWSSAVTTSGEVTFTPPVEKKQLVMTSGSLPLPTKAERKKAKKKSIVFVPNQTTTASNFSLKEIKRINSIPQFVLTAEPGSAWKMAYNKRARTKHTVYSTYSFPENRMQFIDPRDKDFAKNSIYFFVKRVGNQSIFMTMSGKLFAFALEDKSIKNLIERAF